MTKVLFDYDSIKYAVGFASEERHIICTHVNNGGAALGMLTSIYIHNRWVK